MAEFAIGRVVGDQRTDSGVAFATPSALVRGARHVPDGDTAPGSGSLYLGEIHAHLLGLLRGDARGVRLLLLLALLLWLLGPLASLSLLARGFLRSLRDLPGGLLPLLGDSAGARFDSSGEVGRISSPTLVIHGAEDRYVPLANARALAEAVPGAVLRVIDDAGHLVFIERSEDVNEAVTGFLERRQPRRPGAGESSPDDRGGEEQEGGQDLAQQAQERALESALEFFGASLGALKSNLEADRAELESVAAHFPYEGLRLQIQVMVAAYSAGEESLDLAARSAGVDI